MTMMTLKRVPCRTSFEYRDDRGSNLLEVFNRLFIATPDAHVDDILLRTVNHPARRFWVSEERALRVVRTMRRRGLPATCNPLKREMYEEIYRRVCRLQTEHPDWPLKRRVYAAVNEEAPKFYLSPGCAHVIVLEEKKKCRIETMRRLSRFLAA